LRTPIYRGEAIPEDRHGAARLAMTEKEAPPSRGHSLLVIALTSILSLRALIYQGEAIPEDRFGFCLARTSILSLRICRRQAKQSRRACGWYFCDIYFA